MTITEFGECLEYNIEHDLKHAVLGLGAPGVGKSQLIRQIGEKYGYKVIDIRLAQMSEVEIGGLIYPNKERTKTVWLSPEVLPDEARDGEKTILLLDEITSCTKRVQVAAYQLILDRRVGQYTLPKGCFVVALGNREDDDGVYIQLAGPLADRFEIHYIDVDFKSWKNWAVRSGIHPWIINYLSFKPDGLHNQKPDDNRMVFATPRSWERVSQILHFDSDITKPVIRHKVIGNVGQEEGAQFLEFCMKQSSTVTAEDFIAGRAKAPKEPDLLNILVNSMLTGVSFLAKVSSPALLTADQRTTVENTISAFFRLPQAEFTILGLKGLVDLNRTAAKQIFLEMDEDSIIRFVHKNSYALGLTPNAGK